MTAGSASGARAPAVRRAEQVNGEYVECGSAPLSLFYFTESHRVKFYVSLFAVGEGGPPTFDDT